MKPHACHPSATTQHTAMPRYTAMGTCAMRGSAGHHDMSRALYCHAPAPHSCTDALPSASFMASSPNALRMLRSCRFLSSSDLSFFTSMGSATNTPGASPAGAPQPQPTADASTAEDSPAPAPLPDSCRRTAVRIWSLLLAAGCVEKCVRPHICASCATPPPLALAISSSISSSSASPAGRGPPSRTAIVLRDASGFARLLPSALLPRCDPPPVPRSSTAMWLPTLADFDLGSADAAGAAAACGRMPVADEGADVDAARCMPAEVARLVGSTFFRPASHGAPSAGLLSTGDFDPSALSDERTAAGASRAPDVRVPAARPPAAAVPATAPSTSLMALTTSSSAAFCARSAFRLSSSSARRLAASMSRSSLVSAERSRLMRFSMAWCAFSVSFRSRRAALSCISFAAAFEDASATMALYTSAPSPTTSGDMSASPPRNAFKKACAVLDTC
mmetsp:Transcript_37655/g.111389  ORF Transcript_37655/g.111389 Transcript_37655/m.111389 type:complete len:448 (+) Transcript_37655:643-1986(+)